MSNIESIKKLRNESIQIMTDYAKRENVTFEEVRNFVFEQVDEPNMLLPFEMYRRIYNYCVENLKPKK